MSPARPVVSQSAESPSPPPLVVRCFAAALRTWSAAEVLVKAFLHALPFLFAAVFRAGPTSRNVLLATVALVLDLVQSFVTFLAAEALLRNRPWARPWIICVSLMAVVPLLAGGDRWVAGWQELARQADQPLRVAIVLLGGQGFVVVAGIALLVLLVYEPIAAPHGSIPRGDWVLSASAVLCLLATRHVIAASKRAPSATPAPVARKTRDTVPIESGHGTLRLTLFYDAQPLASVAGTDAYVTLRDMNTGTQRWLSAPVVDGAITLPDVPAGAYVANVIVDADRENGLDGSYGMPGDYQGFHGGIAVHDAETAAGDVSMSLLLRLLAPEDTRFPLPFTKRGFSELTGPVTFEWAPVPHVTRYRWGVWRQWLDGKAWKSDLVQSGTSRATTAGPFALSRSGPGEYYGLDLTAEGRTGRLTKFTVPRTGSLRHLGYGFVVR